MNAPLYTDGVMSIATPAEARRERLARERRMRLREVYGRTEPREGLCQYDARGMDIIEGRM